MGCFVNFTPFYSFKQHVRPLFMHLLQNWGSLREDIRALDNVLDAYYRFDGHFSELGNRLVARRIADYVREKYLGGR